MSNLKHLASVTALLAVITGVGTAEARDRPGTPTDPRVILASPTEVDIYFRNTAGGVLVVFPLEIKLDGKRLHPDLERTVSQNIFKGGGMYGNGEVTRRITSEDLGGRLGPGIEFCFRAWSRTRVRNETYFTASDDVFSEIPSAWACGVPVPNKPPQPTQVISEYRACLDAGSQCRPGINDRAVLVRWLIPTFPFGTTIDRVAVEKKRYLPDVTDWEVDFSKEYVIRHAMKQPQYDGEFLSPPKQDGKYMYRVCLENAAGRECGVANLSLVVENPRILGTARTPGVAVAEAAAPSPQPLPPKTTILQPRMAAIVPAAPIGGARAAAEPITPKPTPSSTPNAGSAMSAAAASTATASATRSEATRTATQQQQPVVVKPPTQTMTTDGAAGTQVVAAADVPTLYKPRGQQGGQPAQDRPTGATGATGATADLPGAAKILCRGGKSMRLEPMSAEIASMLGRGPNGATYTLYFGTTESTVGADGNGLHASTCAYLGQPWKAGDPPGIRFETKPDGAFFYNEAPPTGEETESRSYYLGRPDHYWLFLVKPGHGFFEAVRHDVWKPAVGPKVAATAEAIEAKTTVPKGADAQVSSNLFDMDDRAIIIVGGKKTLAGDLKRDLQRGLQRLSGPPKALSLRKPSAQTLTAASSPAATAQIRHAATSRAAAASELANTPIGIVGSQPAAQRAASLEVDCERLGPHIVLAPGRMTSGASFRLEGTCFGARGGIEVRGQFAANGGVLQLKPTRWNANAIEFVTPKLSGVRDQLVTVAVTRGDGKRSVEKAVQFFAERVTVAVPPGKWTPGASLERTVIKEESVPDVLGASRLKPNPSGAFALQASVGVSADCALLDVGATTRAGQVQSIDGWDAPGPANVATVNVRGLPTCANRVDTYVFETETHQVCSLAVDLTATASCLAGVDP